MEREHAELYEKIQQFRIDEPGSSLTFTQRLARDNLWSLEYAWRVVQEYKRFAFLAVVAGHTVTPSEDVDDAWHLHLLYTRSYWDRFCPDVLGKTLHHDPTRGGDAERAKHADWYAKTLASYEKFFGPPPPDIWPHGETAPKQHAERVHVPRDRYWIVRKQPFAAIAKYGLISLAVTAIGAAPLAAIENPFDMRGQDFLVLYFVLFAIAVLGGLAMRWILRAPTAERTNVTDNDPIHPYEMAWLAGGKDRALDAALSHLVRQDILKLNVVERSFEVRKGLPPKSHPLDKRLLNVVQQDGTATVVREALSSGNELWLKNLRERGLILPQGRARFANLVPTVFLLALSAFGVAKIVVGISRGRPVIVLVLLVLLTFLAAWALSKFRTDRSRLGDRVLRGATKVHVQLRKPSWDDNSLDPAAMAMGVALFSSLALAGGPWKDLQVVLSPPPPERSGGWGGSGCGSGCGGGGGGGGGCGGGGCGGCSS